MSGAKTQALPIPTSPLVDGNGHITNAWYRLILALLQRTGGTAGKVTPSVVDPATVLSSLMGEIQGEEFVQGFWPGDVGESVGATLFLPQDVGQTTFREVVPSPTPSAPPAVEAVVPGASPWVYAPGISGQILVAGGTVGGITWSRDGVTFLPTGLVAGFIPVEPTDSITLTYAVAPAVTLIRRPR